MSQEVVLITRDITTQKYDLLIPLWHCVGTGMDVNIHTHKTCVLTGIARLPQLHSVSALFTNMSFSLRQVAASEGARPCP